MKKTHLSVVSLTLVLFFNSLATVQAQNEVHKWHEPQAPQNRPKISPETPDIPTQPDLPWQQRPRVPDQPISPELQRLRDQVLENLHSSEGFEISQTDLSHSLSEYNNVRYTPEWKKFENSLLTPDIVPVTNPEFIRIQQALNQKVLQEFETKLFPQPNLPFRSQRAAVALAGIAFNEASREALDSGDISGAGQTVKIARQAASFALDLVPVVGETKGILEAVIGYDIVTWEELSTTERVISAATSIPFGKVLKGARALTKFSITAAERFIRNSRFASLLPKIAEEKIGARILESAANHGDEFAKEFSHFVSKFDDAESGIAGSLKSNQIDDFSASLVSRTGRMDARQGVQRIVSNVGDKNALELIDGVDPVVALKTIKDLGASERVTGQVIEASATSRVFHEAAELNEKMMSGEKIGIQMRVNNPSTFEASMRGNTLTTDLVRQRPYTNELFNPALDSGVVQSLEGSGRFSFDASAKLVPDEIGAMAENSVEYVVPVLEGTIDTAKVLPSEFRAMTSGRSMDVVGELSDEAFQAIEYEGRSSMKFLDSTGSEIKLGSRGDQYAFDIPEASKWSPKATERYAKEFGDGVNGVGKTSLEPGQILGRNYGGTSRADGRWFSVRRFNTLEEAEAATNVAKYGNDSTKMDLYVVTDRVNAYVGTNAGAKTGGSELQIFIPNQDVVEAPVNIGDITKRILFDSK